MSNKVFFLILFVIFWNLFFPTKYLIPDLTLDGWIKNFMLLGVFLYFRNDIYVFLFGEFRRFNKALILYCIICVISVLVNSSDVSRYNCSLEKIDGSIVDVNAVISPKQTIYYCISLISMTMLIERVSYENKTDILYRYLFYFMLPLVIWVDIDAFNHVVVNGAIGGYIVGTKFQVCYFHFFLIILYYLNHPNLNSFIEKLTIFVLIIVSWFLCAHTECSTMKFGTLLFVIFLFLPSWCKTVLFSEKLVVFSSIILGIGFFLFTSWALQFEIVENVIVGMLNEDMTLTGRLGIFENILEAFQQPAHLAFGYGNGNSVVISIFYGCGYNPQNGLIEVFLNIGILGCLSFLWLMYQSFSRLDYKSYYKYPIVVFVYIMIIVSMIEVPFDRIFMFFIILLLADVSERKKQVLKYLNT